MHNGLAAMALVAFVGLAAAGVMIMVVVWFSKRSDARTAARLSEARATAVEAMAISGEDERVRREIQLRHQETSGQLQIARMGIATTARVVAAEQTYRRTGGGDPVVDLVVELHGPAGPYQVQMTVAVQLLDIPLCQPGRAIQARVDPDDRNGVVVLFDHRILPAAP